jgi:uncharacterized protein (TIGR04255 family)
MSRSGLPKFGNPPVVEVALSIMFDTLPAYRAAHAGLLWQRIRDQFPDTEDLPEIPPTIEEPSGPASAPPRLELMERPRVRTWFRSADGTQLVQVQSNRLAYNWKKGSAEHHYPSYDEVEGGFRQVLPIFEEFVSKEGLGKIEATQAELTYVNHIQEPHNAVDRVFNFFHHPVGNGFLPPPEDVVHYAARYPIVEASKEVRGRLIVELQPAYLTSDRSEILRLTLIARGKPLAPDIDGALAFLNIGHEWIVNGFAELTTTEMQAKWERRQ